LSYAKSLPFGRAGSIPIGPAIRPGPNSSDNVEL
jgi:hypothetical protein